MRKAFRPPLKRALTEDQKWEDMSWQKKVRRCITEEKPLPGDPPKEGRTPLLNLPIPGYDPSGRSNPQEMYFDVLWRKQTNRKHKTWDGDGVVIVAGGSLVLRDSDGSQIGSKVWGGGKLGDGDLIKVGSMEVQIEALLSNAAYLSGSAFVSTTPAPTTIPPLRTAVASTSYEQVEEQVTSAYLPTATMPPKAGVGLIRSTHFPPRNVPSTKGNIPAPNYFPTTTVSTQSQSAISFTPSQSDSTTQDPEDMTLEHFLAPVLPLAHYPTPFVPPRQLQTGALHTALTIPKKTGPRHDPTALDAVVLTRPKMPPGTKAIDVVVDPFISRHLRRHQKEGVGFLYECVMGIKDFGGTGAILADEMGLGKTLTVISLIWTLLKQSPFPGKKSIIKKVLVVCPVTLIDNWKHEFRKWLGKERIGVLILDTNTDLRNFHLGPTYQVLITNYEKVIKSLPGLTQLNFDLVICDEAHRLKTQGNKSAKAIKSLSTTRRILLTGTPIQNDLGEFYTMVDFVNPGLLGSSASFKKNYEVPIVKARQPNARKEVMDLGRKKSEELSLVTGMFMLRRTSEILTKYLPRKRMIRKREGLMIDEYVVFCKPSGLQERGYLALLQSQGLKNCLYQDDMSSHLKAITLMRKLCNGVSLVSSKVEAEPDDPLYSSLASIVPRSGENLQPGRNSGKLAVLRSLLVHLRQTTLEKIVLVSNFTSTLDLLEQLLTANNMKWCRLDGTTDNSKRQPLVTGFNQSTADDCFAFLLSSKSGGCGLNLVGASRLVLYDVDWNPSNDLQAMARIHRDGQKREVHIYRFLSTGMMDEKIYQRQITKQGLAESFMDGKGSSGNSFTLEELKNLFSYRETCCDTHDLLDCPCNGNGVTVSKDLLTNNRELLLEQEETGFIPASQILPESENKKGKHKFDALHEFWHFDPQKWKDRDDDNEYLCDIIVEDVLREVIQAHLAEGQPNSISYLFGKKG